MSANKVKFRKAVTPGDTLEIRVKLLRYRANKLAMVSCECRVQDKVVSEAEIMFSIVDA